jgi:hypothetical protein
MAKSGGGGKNYRNAGSGEFVTKAYAAAHPKTTVSEVRGGGSTNGANRSAITGKFVGEASAARWPDRTIKDS